MDISKAIEPKSDQLNASDLILGPQTFTIAKVEEGSSEQPVNIHLVELDKRPYRPSKTMLRVLGSQWGKLTQSWTGRRITLFRNPSVKWAGKEIGGIEVSHMSDIPKKFTITLPVSKGAVATYSVQPLPDAPVPRPETWEELADQANGDVPTLQNLYTEAQKQGADTKTLEYIRGKAGA